MTRLFFSALCIVMLIAAATVAQEQHGGAESGYPAAERDSFHIALARAKAGDRFAQFDLGMLYYNGRGVAQDYTKAVQWYRLAAGQGHEMAQLGLGVMYYHGKGVAQDYTEAAQWYRRAAGQGNPEAQLGLGVMYAAGEGVPVDYVQAYTWYHRAAAQGAGAAALFRDELRARMSPAHIAEAQKVISGLEPGKHE